jgi:hypothetical protein
MKIPPSPCLLALACFPAMLPLEAAPLSIPAQTAYSVPDAGALRIRDDRGIPLWQDPAQSAVWFGQFQKTGALTARLKISLPPGRTAKLRLTLGGRAAEALVSDRIRLAAGDTGAPPAFRRKGWNDPVSRNGRSGDGWGAF